MIITNYLLINVNIYIIYNIDLINVIFALVMIDILWWMLKQNLFHMVINKTI